MLNLLLNNLSVIYNDVHHCQCQGCLGTAISSTTETEVSASIHNTMDFATCSCCDTMRNAPVCLSTGPAQIKTCIP